MVLSDVTIRRMINEGKLVNNEIDDVQIQPASLDFKLGDTFSVLCTDPSKVTTMSQELKYTTIKSDKYILRPGHFVLGTTKEYFNLPDDIVGFVEGRSSIGRLGLFIQNAGWVDPGFEGEITLELFNASDVAIELEAGRRVGQLVFLKMDNVVESPYRGKYQGQKGATGSKIFLDNGKNNPFGVIGSMLKESDNDDGIEYVCESVNTDTRGYRGNHSWISWQYDE